MRQVKEGFESEFQSKKKKKKALEADMANELELERQRIEEKYRDRSSTIENMLTLISFEIPEEDPAGISTVTEVENEPVEKEVVETSAVDVVEEPMDEKVQDPTLAQPSSQVKKVLF